MPRISDTITRLQNAMAAPRTSVIDSALQPLTAFGSNPGALNAWHHIPEGVESMPLVVVLHGCTQNAVGYDHGAGWSALADRFGFALLFPEQAAGNNANRCFNWFMAEDTRRGGGEALSIRQMIAAMVDRHGVDPARVFITGLSAGGAMASVMLATYPEVFTGGAIIAGLPYGSAASVSQAFDRMRGRGHADDAAYAAAIRAASPHDGPWPSVSVWQGGADTTVNVVNADRITGQWRALQGLADMPDSEETTGGIRHREWRDPAGEVRVEEYRIAGMGHGTPLATRGDTRCGTPAPYMLDAGISSTWHIADRWGLLGEERVVASVGPEAPAAAPLGVASGVQATIETALRSAGLMH